MRTYKPLRAAVTGSRFHVLALSGLAAAAVAYGATHPQVATAQSVQDLLPNFHSFVPAEPQGGKSRAKTQKAMRTALQAWRQGDYTRAHAILTDVLARGNTVAAWYLGHIYQQGRGVPPNRAIAFNFYRQMADQLHRKGLDRQNAFIAVDALVRVADGYRIGIKAAGVPKDPGQALEFYVRARSNYEHPGADHGIAMVYLDARVGRKKHRTAWKLLHNAATKGYAPSMSALGDLRWQGKLVQHSKARAIMWYMLARDHAGREQRTRVSRRLRQMLSKATSEERVEAATLAERWIKRHSGGRTIRPISD